MEKTFIDKIKALPIELQDAITSPEFGEKLELVGEKYNLHIDQIDELANEVLAIMIGDAKPTDFFDRIEKSLGLSEDTARSLTNDVNEQIFLPLRSALQEPSEPAHPLETPDEILKHIEDAGPALPAPDLTDHLLQNTVESKPIEEVAKEITPPPAPTAPPKKTYKVDPYREPIN